MEAVGSVVGVLNKLLELFQQKALVFVDVSFGEEKPYALTVTNISRFDVLLYGLTANPDGFPSVHNGWGVNDCGLFKQKILKPTQRIRLLLSSRDIGNLGLRTFTIRYATLIRGRKIPRYEQTCEYDFDRDSFNIKVAKSVKVNYECR